MTRYIGVDKVKTRTETLARLPAFCKALDKLLGDGARVMCLEPNPHELAATVDIYMRHVKGNRKMSPAGSIGAVYALLTLEEKNAIATAVGQAACEAGLEVWFKPTASSDEQLCYRVFWKEAK